MKCEKCKKLEARVDNLEAMVAMAQPPSIDDWPATVIFSWINDQRKIQKRLDGIAKRMKEREAVR